jgi:hypothetical protein
MKNITTILGSLQYGTDNIIGIMALIFLFIMIGAVAYSTDYRSSSTMRCVFTTIILSSLVPFIMTTSLAGDKGVWFLILVAFSIISVLFIDDEILTKGFKVNVIAISLTLIGYLTVSIFRVA